MEFLKMVLFSAACAASIGGLIFGVAWLMQKMDQQRKS